MASERFVVLGVAQVRSGWFREVARWATSAMLPVEFVKAMSLEEVRVLLRAGRGYSALLVDDSLGGLDRDVLELAREGGCAVVVVDSGRTTRAWSELGASAVLPSTFGRDDLLQALTQVARPIARSTRVSPTVEGSTGSSPGFRGRLVAVTGSGGTGRSTIAAALAQGLAHDPRNHDLVCLADLALHAEQAMLHGSPDVVPGVVEVVEAHRAGQPSIDEVRRLTWHVAERDYRLLLGLRRHRDWTMVPRRSFEAGLDGLRRGFRVVVADIDADLEGEQATGSLDVEERNTMSRTTVLAADLVLVVGLPGMKGLHSVLRTTRDLLAHEVPGSRLLPVFNRAPKNPRARAELTSAFGELLGDEAGRHRVPSPLHLPERRGLDEVLRDGVPFPESWFVSLATTVQALLDRADGDLEPPSPPDGELLPVAPGSLGSWTSEG